MCVWVLRIIIAMDHRVRKVEIRIKRNFVPILNLQLVKEMREGSVGQTYPRFLEWQIFWGVELISQKLTGEMKTAASGLTSLYVLYLIWYYLWNSKRLNKHSQQGFEKILTSLWHKLWEVLNCQFFKYCDTSHNRMNTSQAQIIGKYFRFIEIMISLFLFYKDNT